jgi:hypothetical protein
VGEGLGVATLGWLLRDSGLFVEGAAGEVELLSDAMRDKSSRAYAGHFRLVDGPRRGGLLWTVGEPGVPCGLGGGGEQAEGVVSPSSVRRVQVGP